MKKPQSHVSSGEPTSSCPPNWLQAEPKRRAGDIQSIQPSFVQPIIDTTAQVEPIPNPYPLPVIGLVCSTDSGTRPADPSRDDKLVIDQENFDME